MKIPFRTMDLSPRGRVVGCGVQGSSCLALALSQGRRGKWSIDWSLAGEMGDEEFAARLSRMTGNSHFWVSPSEEGGLQVEAVQAIEIPEVGLSKRGSKEDFFVTQIRSRFVNETVMLGGMSTKGPGKGAGKVVHNVGGGAIRDNVKSDYLAWYSKMSIRRPHIASTALALANSYLALYPQEKRLAKPLRVVVLKGRSVYRAILMDDWKYVDELLLPRMEGDDASASVIGTRTQGWIDYFKRQHPGLADGRDMEPLIISVQETHVSEYEHWDLWGEHAMDKIDMSESVAEAILSNRDIAPIAFGMALQGGC